MSLELVRETVRLNQPIGEDLTQTIVENDIIVPDIKPDIVRILLLDGDAYINSVEAASDKLLIGGTVRYKILYVSDDPEQSLKSINTTSGFQYTMDIPNVRQGMQCRVKSDVMHMEYEILNSRKVNVKAIVSLSGRVTSQVDQLVAQGIEGVEGIQILGNSVGVNSYIGDSESACPVKETLEIPAGKPTILEVLRNDVKITGKEFKLTEGKIVANGELNISTLYIGDDETRSIQFMEHEIPFSQLVEMPDIDEGSYGNVEFEIGEMSFEPLGDADGELRQLKCEAMVKVYSECFSKKEINLVEDAYSPKSRISLEKEQLKMEELLDENKSQITLKETVEIEEESPDISEVFNVLCKLSLSGSEIADDRVVLEGVVGCNILYLAGNEEQPVFCTDRDIAFKQTLDVKGARAGMGLDVEMEIEHCSYSMVSAKEVEVRLVIGLLTRVSRQVTVPVVARASEQALDESRLAGQPSITIYFTQQGDTLWKIAKKYYTTMDEIRKDNDVGSSDILPAGEQILIPRKI
ncbi:MAG: SPOCS domain-containing protein [Clostridiaceae bacterium]